MPNMIDDGFLVQAIVAQAAAKIPSNSDFLLQAACSTAIMTAANIGLSTCTVVADAYATALIQAMIQRLVNMGYTASVSGTVITVNW